MRVVFTLKIPKRKKCTLNTRMMHLTKKLSVEFWTLNSQSFNYVSKGSGLSDSNYEWSTTRLTRVQGVYMHSVYCIIWDTTVGKKTCSLTVNIVSNSSLSIFPLPSWSKSLKYHLSFWLIPPLSIKLIAAIYSTKSMYPS